MRSPRTFTSLTNLRLLVSFSSDKSFQLLTTLHSRFPSIYRQRPNPDTRTASAKMVQKQGINVYIAPFNNINKRYPQHGVPANSPNFTGDPNEVYIEAVDGERFVVITDLKKNFNMHGAEHLYILWEVDQDCGENACGDYFTLPDLEARAPPGTASKGRCTLSTTSRKIDGAWMNCGFAFAALSIGNGPYLPMSIMQPQLMPDRRTIGYEHRRDRERSRHAR